MKSWVVEKKRYTTRLQNIHSTWTLKAFFFLPKNTKKNPCFQEIPLFAGSIYFTLPEIVMGPIWVPNASINTSWTNLGILIIGRKDILKILKEFSSNF